MKDKLGDLYKVIMRAHLLAAIISGCNKSDWSDTLHFLNIQKASPPGLSDIKLSANGPVSFLK
jgi:hypothetical protein